MIRPVLCCGEVHSPEAFGASHGKGHPSMPRHGRPILLSICSPKALSYGIITLPALRFVIIMLRAWHSMTDSLSLNVDQRMKAETLQYGKEGVLRRPSRSAPSTRSNAAQLLFIHTTDRLKDSKACSCQAPSGLSVRHQVSRQGNVFCSNLHLHWNIHKIHTIEYKRIPKS